MTESSQELRSFVRNVIKVAKKRQEKEKIKSELGNHIEKIKNLAVKKNIKKTTVSRALKELEKKISTLIEQEKQTLELQRKDIAKTNKIDSDTESMQKQFRLFSEQDVRMIDELRNRIKQIEEGKGSQITRMADELKSKLNEIENSRAEREKRIIELEKKVKKSVTDNFIELMSIEQQLANMEIQYKKMKHEGKYDKGIIRAFKDKIQALKEHLFVKKKNLVEEQMKKGAPLPVNPKEFKKKEIYRDIQKHNHIKNRIIHDVRIKPVEGAMPLPPHPENEQLFSKRGDELIPEIRLRRETKKKKGFFKRLFG